MEENKLSVCFHLAWGTLSPQLGTFDSILDQRKDLNDPKYPLTQNFAAYSVVTSIKKKRAYPPSQSWGQHRCWNTILQGFASLGGTPVAFGHYFSCMK